MANVYIYVVKYDFGFAPNPFGGVCTLSCCKPKIRKRAVVGDWVIGMGGRDLKATGRCVFATQITGAMTFEEYWASPDFRGKRPKRNGSRKKMVGDNIYWRDPETGAWNQENSIHSRQDGSRDPGNTGHDTSVDRILISERFLYFGINAPTVPARMLTAINYKNGRGHRVFTDQQCKPLLDWVVEQGGGPMNLVLGNPFQFHQADKRYSLTANRMI